MPLPLNSLDSISLLIIGLGLFGLVKSLPRLLAVINPRRIRCWFADVLDRDETISRSQALKARLQELEALGFSLLGIKNEKFPLWGQAVREVATVSTAAEIFGCLVITERGEPFTVYFYTPIREDGFVYTRQQATLPEMEGPNISVKNFSSPSLKDMFQAHRDRVETFKQKGLLPAMVSSPEARIEATYRFYASNYARKILGFSVMAASIPCLLLAGALVYLGRQS